MNFDWKGRVLVKVIAGSRAFGTAVETSDTDYRGVIVPPEEYFYGLSHFEQYEVPGQDEVYHEFRRFLRLTSAGNPSFLEVWWAPESKETADPEPHERIQAAWWRKTKRDLWSLLLSKKLLKPHLGMAQAHLAKLEHGGKNCGVKGREAIAEFGWNTKDASHVIRVLHQAHELLTRGALTFPRPEAAMLMDIRKGNWTLDQVHHAEADLTKLIREVAEKSDLREEPDVKAVNQWLVLNMPKVLEEFRFILPRPPEFDGEERRAYAD